ERQFGKGRVIWGKTPREVLLADGVKPDFTFTGQEENPEQFDYIHRTSGDSEIYFVINRTNMTKSSNFTFRISGKQPEIWNPVTGEMLKANSFIQANGCTTLPLEFDQFGSNFIVFRKPISNNESGKAKRNSLELSTILELGDSWKVSFDPEWGGPGEVAFPKLTNWIDNLVDGIKYYSGKATYRKSFNLIEVDKELKNGGIPEKRLFLDLGKVEDVAEVRLNGKKLGILWCPPWRVEITGTVKPSGNSLEIDVINLWANRVIGDLNLPKDKRFTKTHDGFRFDMIKGNTPLLDSGLLGPVRIMKE
ncbi:MAG: glycosylhydrolase-like jelly roll fold domain-containing protein, partial [Mariniphaga sp.]